MKSRAVAWRFAAALLAAAGTAEALDRTNSLTLYGGVHRHFSSGKAEEYVLGRNDFPVVPAHNGILAGFSLIRMFGRTLGAEIDARFVGTSPVVLTDPSDGDIVELTAGPHVTVTLGVFLAPFSGTVRPYLSAGGGLDASLAGDASSITRYGFVIEVPAPAFKDRFDPEAHAGAGLLVLPGKGRTWGFRLDSRYAWIFDGSRTISGLSGSAGFFLAF